MKDHACGLQRRLAVEGDQRIEAGPDQRPGTRARHRAGNGLVEKRFDKTFFGQVGPVDHRDGPGKVESDRRPAREISELYQCCGPMTSVAGQRSRNPLRISVRASSVCCAARNPGRSQTRKGLVLAQTNCIAALWSELAVIDS